MSEFSKIYTSAQYIVNQLDKKMKHPLMSLEQKIDICFQKTRILGECRVLLNNDKTISTWFADGYMNELNRDIDKITKKRLELQAQLAFLNNWFKRN